MPIAYFAYGSNMASHRLLRRLPGARHVEVGILTGHRLNFRKKDDAGLSAKCDIELTDDHSDEVIGVVYEISIDDKQTLDQIEGLGTGYDEKIVQVTTLSAKILSSVTYFAIDIDHNLIPYHWYKQHVLRGAIEHGLPADYIRKIESFESQEDADERRRHRELSIYL
ncbi:MAG: gamma-glutamylcyclotransferase family protein [Gammaproteobacteria bacterium]